jgi:alpha-galactosidase
MKSPLGFIGALLVTSGTIHSGPVAPKPVLVFILAGQSNMEGHGFVPADPKRNGGKGSLEFLTKHESTAKHFAPSVTG